MKPFIHEDFLLQSDVARHLFHDHAEHLPIIDYHCHLDPQTVAEDHRFGTITELWLSADHYKWRALRTNGVAEKYITGDASDWEKFQKWAETMPYLFRNPLYHWTHLELKTCFGIDEILNADSAERIYRQCNEMLASPEFSARNLMLRYNVEAVCTTDDPVDSLEYHIRTREDGFKVKVLPAWRPDKAMAVDNPESYRNYIDRLAQVSGTGIGSYRDVLSALVKRHDFFAAQGCRLSDHGMDEFYNENFTEEEIEAIFDKVYNRGQNLSECEIRKFRTAMLLEFGKMDAEAGWTQQFHYGPMRNNNTKMFRAIGPDTGFDSIGQSCTARSMAGFLDRLNSMDRLGKTIIYNLNPSDNAMVASMIGNFQDGSIPGKIQFGAGWWFSDQKDGMEKQIGDLSMMGLLSRFVGMLTDSRSLVSYTRHEYFRRILCNILGRDVENGELPSSEMPQIERMVEDISYFNAKRYFEF